MFSIIKLPLKTPQVQVIPWVMSDGNYVRCPSYQLDPHKTVFIGALHGMLSAEALANIINDLFGGVVYAGQFVLFSSQILLIYVKLKYLLIF